MSLYYIYFIIADASVSRKKKSLWLKPDKNRPSPVAKEKAFNFKRAGLSCTTNSSTSREINVENDTYLYIPYYNFTTYKTLESYDSKSCIGSKRKTVLELLMLSRNFLTKNGREPQPVLGSSNFNFSCPSNLIAVLPMTRF